MVPRTATDRMISHGTTTPAERFGYEVLGPIMGEFCLRLWAVASQMERTDDVAFLFCARGGLRLQLAYERFLAATGYSSPVPIRPLMVSRLVALRASLWQTMCSGEQEIGPAASTAVSYEFRRASVLDWARAMTGASPAGGARWDGVASPIAIGALLNDADGEPVRAVLAEQAELFRRHLDNALADRRHAVLIDTGLYGTTRQLLAEGVPDIEFSSALIARARRPGDQLGATRSVGLSLNASGYSPVQTRTALLRYWHFVEWFLEPELQSVRLFVDVSSTPRSNLEVPAWRDRVDASHGSPFAGVLRYLDDLPAAPGARIASDADRAWRRFRRAVVWPSRTDAEALRVGTRSHDFGLAGTWSTRAWQGPLAAVRGTSMWREGEIAESGTRLRLPLLAGIEAAYGARQLARSIRNGRGNTIK